MRFRWLISAQCPFFDAALDLDRPDGSTQGGFMVGFTTSRTSPARISSHVTHVLVVAQSETKRVLRLWLERCLRMSEGLAECEWISGVLESALNQDYEPSLHRRKSILLPAEPTVTIMKADSHLQVDPSTVCVIDAKKSAFDHVVREEDIADGQHKNFV